MHQNYVKHHLELPQKDMYGANIVGVNTAGTGGDQCLFNSAIGDT